LPLAKGPRFEFFNTLLSIREEINRASKVAYWKEVYQRHAARVRAELLAEQRRKYGPDWGDSVGGKWWLNAMTHKVLMERYGRR
jgi:hypothetical protein